MKKHQSGRIKKRRLYFLKKELISLNRKEEICVALKRLMKRKSIQKITIQEIADECGISRYTFYYHFQDIYDCLSWMLQEGLRERFQEIGENPDWEAASTSFVEDFRENRTIYKHLLTSPRPDLIRNFLHQEIQPLVQIYISKTIQSCQYQVSDSYLDFLTNFFTSAMEGMLIFWFERNLDCSDEQLVAYFHTILDGQFESILERAANRGFCTKVACGMSHDDSAPWACML